MKIRFLLFLILATFFLTGCVPKSQTNNVWSVINETTWRKDNGRAGETVKSDEFVVGDIDKQDENLPLCKNWSDIQKNKNKMAFIEGTFRIFHPRTKGKGANYMFWEWEILLEDNISIPAISKKSSLDLSTFKDSPVRIKGNIFHGIIIGSKEGQSLTGYRIDIRDIWKK